MAFPLANADLIERETAPDWVRTSLVSDVCTGCDTNILEGNQLEASSLSYVACISCMHA